MLGEEDGERIWVAMFELGEELGSNQVVMAGVGEIVRVVVVVLKIVLLVVGSRL